MVIYNNNSPWLKIDLYSPPKSAKNTYQKCMFFPYIFVNIDHREIFTEYNIVRLIKIHKSNSIHFLSKWHSFRVFGCQSWHKLHIIPHVPHQMEELNASCKCGMCGSVDFCN